MMVNKNFVCKYRNTSQKCTTLFSMTPCEAKKVGTNETAFITQTKTTIYETVIDIMTIFKIQSSTVNFDNNSNRCTKTV